MAAENPFVNPNPKNPFNFNANIQVNPKAPAVTKVAEKCSTGGFTLSSQYWRTWLFMCFATILIFVLLSPGLILSLPTNSVNYCASKIPLPGGATGQCNSDNGTYIPGGSDPINPTMANPICNQRQACGQVFGSGYVSTLTSVFHAVIFVIFINLFSSYLIKGKGD